MATLTFLLPPNLPSDAQRELERASVGGAPDQMPLVTHSTFEDDRLVLSRPAHDSGFLLAPWDVPGVGRLLLRSATLIERSAPYHLTQELARGTINRLRCQLADWRHRGLDLNPELEQSIRQATFAFGKTISVDDVAEVSRLSEQALILGLRAAETLVDAYTRQLFHLRHRPAGSVAGGLASAASAKPQAAPLSTSLGCRLQGLPVSEDARRQVSEACNVCGVNVPWKVLEPIEGELNWQPFEALLAWAESQGLPVLAGPLLDFSGYGIPDWLWGKDLDLTLLCDFLCEFVERTVRRYQGRVKHWHLVAGSNLAGVVARSEDELLWLTVRLLEAARQMDASAEFCIGLAQPFGDYLSRHEHTHSPLAFADTLLRTSYRATLNALELELVMGVSPRGSYCRNSLEVSRLIDMYTCLGVPLQVTMSYPSAHRPDALADSDLSTPAGHWHDGLTSASQADWAEQFATLALCAPAVRTVMWSHFDDALPHQFPHGGLVDSQGNIKPALERLRALRQEHLK